MKHYSTHHFLIPVVSNNRQLIETKTNIGDSMPFYPALIKRATVKKFMVGCGMFGLPHRDITAEIETERLRNLI